MTMMIPKGLFELAIWGAIVAVSLGLVFLVTTLLRDARDHRLW